MKKQLFLFLLGCIGMIRPMYAADTDISALDNIVYIESFTATPGTTELSVSLQMKNSAPIRGFQFDLVLPEGVTPATYASGNIKCELSKGRLEEGDSHTLTVEPQTDGSYRFLCGSMQDETFTGTTGEVATLKVNISASMALGDYPIVLKTMKLSETNINKYYETASIEATLTISSSVRTVLEEDNTTEFDDAAGVDVLVRRTIVAGVWNTIVLPFSMTAEQVKAAFGTDVKLAEFSAWEADGNNVKLTFTEGITAIEANHPYLIKVTTGLTEFTADNVNIAPKRKKNGSFDEPYTEVKIGKKYGYFTGTYTVKNVPVNALFLSDNALWFCTGSNTIKAFRAYFELDDVEYSAGARLTFSVDDSGLTGITERSYSNSDSERVFNLQGQPVTTPANGIYIINGKKTIIK